MISWRDFVLVELIKRGAMHPSTGTISMNDVLTLALPALDNANVKVRQAAVVVLVLSMEPTAGMVGEDNLVPFLQVR